MIILIGNYKPDEQESMIRFSDMLFNGLIKEGIETRLWIPTICFGIFFGNTKTSIAKWVGYIDKWLFYPLVLKIQSLKIELGKKGTVRYHICDHSNSMYYKWLPENRTSITCHDVLAIKGALGYKDAYCTSTKTGKYLQHLIFKNLKQVNKIACVSNYTLKELSELVGDEKPQNANWQTIPNSFNSSFSKIPSSDSNAILKNFGTDSNVPFIFHVGSSHERKNRQLLIKLLGVIKDEWNGIVIFAGEKLNEELLQLVEKYGLQKRIIDVGKITHEELVAFYSSCFVFIFPSLSEGFGWPIIEAQACEAPVITVNYSPMNEVAGEAALFANPNNLSDFKMAFDKLKDEKLRTQLIQKGKQNIERFRLDIVTKEYIRFINS